MCRNCQSNPSPFRALWMILIVRIILSPATVANGDTPVNPNFSYVKLSYMVHSKFYSSYPRHVIVTVVVWLWQSSNANSSVGVGSFLK